MENYIEQMVLRTCHCDMSGEWRPGAVLEAMQETAGAHCSRLGIGRAATDALGVAWVLSRSRIEMRRLPRIGERISIETYPTRPRHMFFPRVNVFRDERGGEIGCAVSLWALLDMATRRMTTQPEVQARIPDNADAPARGGMPATIRALEGEAARQELTPQYLDFDLNNHVNNTKYLDWCCNALGFEVMGRKRLMRFDVNYEAEVRPGERIMTELVLRDDSFSFCGFLEGRRCFAVAGGLAAREDR